jgi:hypothetical protein
MNRPGRDRAGSARALPPEGHVVRVRRRVNLGIAEDVVGELQQGAQSLG